MWQFLLSAGRRIPSRRRSEAAVQARQSAEQRQRRERDAAIRRILDQAHSK